MIKKTLFVLVLGLFTLSILSIGCKKKDDSPEEPPTNSGTFTDDRDGKIYHWKKIGDLVWMTENLAFLAAQNTWAYNNDPGMVEQYGYLYSWDAANAAVPDGWHMATDQEWKELQIFLGMSQSMADETGWLGNVGKKLKATTGWNNDGGGTDDVGFHAVPGGYYLGGGAFDQLGESAHFWTATEDTEFNPSYAWLRILSSNNDPIFRGHNDKGYGYSVRCVRD